MSRDNRKLAFVLLPLALAYPAYEAADVAISGGMGEHCTRPSGKRGIGLFCGLGLRLGELLFGGARAHLGYSLLLGATVVGFAAFALWIVYGGSGRGDRGAGG